jgi:transposase InsO family protein
MNALAKLGTEALVAVSRPASSEARHLTPEQQACFKERLRLIEPMLSFRDGRLVPLQFEDGCEVRNLHDLSEWIAVKNGCSKQKVWWLYCAYLQGGTAALEPKSDPRRGVSLTFARKSKLRAFVMQGLKDGLNVAHLTNEIERVWGKSLLPYVGEPPSYKVVRAFIQSQPGALLDYARLPQRKCAAKHAPYLKTGRGQHTRPNEVWICDHRLYDVLAANDCFPEEPEGRAIRLWETCIQDMRTRAIVASVWSVNPSSRSIAQALRQGISRFGKPEIFYVDNGKDYCAIGAGARRGSLLAVSENAKPEQSDVIPRGLLARLDISVSYCTPYHPQAKQVESYFNFVSQRFDQMFTRSGYTGRTSQARTDFCREQEKQHKEFLAGKRRASPLYPASEFMKLHRGFVEEFNREHKHSGIGMNGRTPMEVMDELLPPAQRIIPDMSGLEPFFWSMVLRKVGNCKVQLNGSSYSPDAQDAEGMQKMYLASNAQNGGQVAVYFDPADPAYAVAFENVPWGKRLALLFSDEIAARQRMTPERVQEMCRVRAKLEKATREAWEIGVAGVPSAVERLAARHGMEPPEHYSPAVLPARGAVMPRTELFACEVSDEAAALLDQVEVDE